MIRQTMNFILNIHLYLIILPWNEKIEDKKFSKQAKSIFSGLKTDPNSVLFYEEEVDKRFLKKLKKSKYEKDALLLKVILLADNNLENEGKTPTRVDFVEKREIDRSTLYSFNRPFQLLHADVKI